MSDRTEIPSWEDTFRAENPDFILWLDVFLPAWESEYSGSMMGLLAAWKAGKDSAPSVTQYKDALSWAIHRLDVQGLKREGMGRIPDKYDEVRKLAYGGY